MSNDKGSKAKITQPSINSKQHLAKIEAGQIDHVIEKACQIQNGLTKRRKKENKEEARLPDFSSAKSTHCGEMNRAKRLLDPTNLGVDTSSYEVHSKFKAP